jgi:hypothetical protein
LHSALRGQYVTLLQPNIKFACKLCFKVPIVYLFSLAVQPSAGYGLFVHEVS